MLEVLYIGLSTSHDACGEKETVLKNMALTEEKPTLKWM